MNNNNNNKQKKKTKKKRKEMKKMMKDDNDNGVVIPTRTGSNSKGNNNKILVRRLFVLFLMVGISTIVYDSKYISNNDSQIMIKMKSNDLIYKDDNEEDDGVVVVNNVRENGQQSQMSRDNNQQQQQQQHNQQQQQPPPQQNQMDMSFEEVMREKKQKDEEDTDTDTDTDDDVNGNDDGVDRRPYLILHVGPPKTGTTTIQSGLFKILKELAIHDNYYYLGEKLGGKVHTIQLNHNNKNNNNKGGQNNSVTTTTKVFPMKDFVYEGQPTQEFCHHIKYHLQQNHNVILSAELFTEHFSRNKWKQLYTNLFVMSSNDNKKSNNNQNTTNSNSTNLEVLFGFNVKIITTYRHLFQWVPSYYHQKHLENLWQDKRTIGIVDYIQDYLINNQNYLNLEKNNNTTTKTKIVHLNKNVKSWFGSRKEIGSGNPNLIHGSIWSYLFWSEQIKSIASSSNSDSNSNIVPKNGNGNDDDDRAYDVSGGELYNRVHVFDMHQQKLNLDWNWNLTNTNKNINNMTQPTTTTTKYNMFTNFICQMIPDANHTCQLLQQQDEEEEEQQRQQDQDQGGQRKRSGGGHHHERSSHTINEYLSLQDRYRIYQMARYGHMTDTNTDTDDTTTTDNNNSNSNRLLIKKFNFKYNKNENKMSKQITDRMKNWFHLQEDEQNNISTTSTDSRNISTDTVFFQRMKEFRCLTDTNLQQLKQLSWNFLVQQILLVRIHHFSNSLANSNSNFLDPNPNPISSDNRANRNANLILSSQFDFNTINNNRNNDNDELLLKFLTPLKLKHDTLFHDYYANTNKFCQINPEKILTNHDFVSYVFRNKYYK